ncbi:WW domain-binding protein 2-like protein [Leptotrombidium deliense]|uniref:WW domain-binding protein 2-like protein n=1 Tax=Leptotrombidium deliense TaxID=299467 RepID=A0A443S0V1_9ACAR|nr:WW domain-binding protein 2-like protein [Leptotrombidium deliense]
MGSLNNSHHEQTGGVCVFNGELILLYCDSVQCEVEGKATVSIEQNYVKGRMYLTTHRIIFTATPLNQNYALNSFSAPFYAMFDISLEQPIFGANYIKGKVRGEGDVPNFVFKLKFSKGGAIEFGQAMNNAAKQANVIARQSHFQPPPPYTPTAASYYQAPDNIYQPSYPIGFVLPTNTFPEAPPPGFVYMTQAPPPYPGITPAHSQQQPMQQQYGTHVGYGNSNPSYPAYPAYPPYQQTNNAQACAPAFNVNNEKPPSYDEAIKKAQ